MRISLDNKQKKNIERGMKILSTYENIKNSGKHWYMTEIVLIGW